MILWESPVLFQLTIASCRTTPNSSSRGTDLEGTSWRCWSFSKHLSSYCSWKLVWWLRSQGDQFSQTHMVLDWRWPHSPGLKTVTYEWAWESSMSLSFLMCCGVYSSTMKRWSSGLHGVHKKYLGQQQALKKGSLWRWCPPWVVHKDWIQTFLFLQACS